MTVGVIFLGVSRTIQCPLSYLPTPAPLSVTSAPLLGSILLCHSMHYLIALYFIHPYFILLGIPVCYCCLLKHYSNVQGSPTWSIEKLLVQLNKLPQGGTAGAWPSAELVLQFVWTIRLFASFVPLFHLITVLNFHLNYCKHEVDVYRELFMRLSRLLSWSPSCLKDCLVCKANVAVPVLGVALCFPALNLNWRFKSNFVTSTVRKFRHYRHRPSSWLPSHWESLGFCVPAACEGRVEELADGSQPAELTRLCPAAWNWEWHCNSLGLCWYH